MVRSTPSTNNNRFGINQFSTQSSRKQKINNAAVHNSPDKKICLFLGSVLSKSDRRRIQFPSSPSKYIDSKTRLRDLKRISKALAIKALSIVNPKPEKVFSIISDPRAQTSLIRSAIPDSPTIKSLTWACKQASTRLQKKRILSLLCLDYSKKAIEKAMGIFISWWLFTESRFIAKFVGPGGDLPDLPYRTLTFFLLGLWARFQEYQPETYW
jgi:hypothetical protein